ncbi:PLP-dependent aminotransferase family protein (plasmid) [Sphingomonas sp. NY01]|uniref:aminotransferase-like domain-containing protein n=1 Tax=Sphingomonas sp. NY01 TaxID=2968057 RepID=UPI00315D20B5
MRNNDARRLTDRLHDDILGRIMAGVLSVGERLPSVRTLSAQQGVSRDTVLRVYDRLVAEGRAQAVRGAGYFVLGQPTPAMDALPIDPRDPLDAMRLVHSDYPLDHQPGSGILRQDAATRAEVTRVLRSVSGGGPGMDGIYGDPLGYLPLRQHLGDGLRHGGVDCPTDAVVTTPGAVAGIGLAVRSMLRAGSVALIEDPCSFMHMHALMAQGAEIRRVPRLADGPDIDMLRELCERYRPKLYVLSSVLHNPTGSTIALHKAQKLVEIAAEFEMVLIDDCSYVDLLPRTVDRPVVPLILLDRLRWVIHVGGFSRTVSPVSGPGYLIAGEAHMRYIRAYRPVTGLGNMILAERTVYRLLSEGLYRRRCSRIQASLVDQRTGLRQRMAAVGFTLPENQAGLFLWLSLGDGVDANAVAERMMARRFLTAPAKHFTIAPDRQSYMRFNVTTTTDDAVALLSNCL